MSKIINKLRILALGISEEKIEIKPVEPPKVKTELSSSPINPFTSGSLPHFPPPPPPPYNPPPAPVKKAVPVTMPKTENRYPIPAIMQEIYKKVLIDNKPIKLLSVRDGIYTVAVSDANTSYGANTVYLLTPDGVRKVPMSYKDHRNYNQVFSKDHITVRRVG